MNEDEYVEYYTEDDIIVEPKTIPKTRAKRRTFTTEEERKAAKLEYSRAYYANNRLRILENAKQYRTKRTDLQAKQEAEMQGGKLISKATGQPIALSGPKPKPAAKQKKEEKGQEQRPDNVGV
jgi:hypothetical protein